MADSLISPPIYRRGNFSLGVFFLDFINLLSGLFVSIFSVDLVIYSLSIWIVVALIFMCINIIRGLSVK